MEKKPTKVAIICVFQSEIHMRHFALPEWGGGGREERGAIEERDDREEIEEVEELEQIGEIAQNSGTIGNRGERFPSLLSIFFLSFVPSIF